MRTILIYIFILLSGLSFTQTKTELKKSRLKIGEQTELKYQIRYDENLGQLSFIPHQNHIPCLMKLKNSSLNTEKLIELEIVKAFKDTIYKENKNIVWIGTYVVTPWDTGSFTIPSQTISTQDSVFTFEEVNFEVISPKLQEGKEIYDIKEQFVEVPTDYTSWLTTYWYWILLLVLIILLTLIFIKKKFKKEVKPEKIMSLKEKSLLAIDALEKAKMWEKSLVKEHYIELSFILRSYLSAQYELNLLEKTSFETSLLLEKKPLEKDTIKIIKTLLDYSDLVKFAKSHPNEYEISKNLAQVRQIIVETSPIEVNHV
jgi:hypothetical protein